MNEEKKPVLWVNIVLFTVVILVPAVVIVSVVRSCRQSADPENKIEIADAITKTSSTTVYQGNRSSDRKPTVTPGLPAKTTEAAVDKSKKVVKKVLKKEGDSAPASEVKKKTAYNPPEKSQVASNKPVKKTGSFFEVLSEKAKKKAAAAPLQSPQTPVENKVMRKVVSVPEPPPTTAGTSERDIEKEKFLKDAKLRIMEASGEKYSEREKQLVENFLESADKITKIHTIYFSVGSKRTSQKDEAVIEGIINSPGYSAMLNNKKTSVFLLGFADPSGSVQGNQRLSLARAESIETVLKEKLNIAQKIISVGVGQTLLLGEGSEKTKNRATEIWLVVP